MFMMRVIGVLITVTSICGTATSANVVPQSANEVFGEPNPFDRALQMLPNFGCTDPATGRLQCTIPYNVTDQTGTRTVVLSLDCSPPTDGSFDPRQSDECTCAASVTDAATAETLGSCDCSVCPTGFGVSPVSIDCRSNAGSASFVIAQCNTLDCSAQCNGNCFESCEVSGSACELCGDNAGGNGGTPPAPGPVAMPATMPVAMPATMPVGMPAAMPAAMPVAPAPTTPAPQAALGPDPAPAAAPVGQALQLGYSYSTSACASSSFMNEPRIECRVQTQLLTADGSSDVTAQLSCARPPSGQVTDYRDSSCCTCSAYVSNQGSPTEGKECACSVCASGSGSGTVAIDCSMDPDPYVIGPCTTTNCNLQCSPAPIDEASVIAQCGDSDGGGSRGLPTAAPAGGAAQGGTSGPTLIGGLPGGDSASNVPSDTPSNMPSNMAMASSNGNVQTINSRDAASGASSAGCIGAVSFALAMLAACA